VYGRKSEEDERGLCHQGDIDTRAFLNKTLLVTFSSTEETLGREAAAVTILSGDFCPSRMSGDCRREFPAIRTEKSGGRKGRVASNNRNSITRRSLAPTKERKNSSIRMNYHAI